MEQTMQMEENLGQNKQSVFFARLNVHALDVSNKANLECQIREQIILAWELHLFVKCTKSSHHLWILRIAGVWSDNCSTQRKRNASKEKSWGRAWTLEWSLKNLKTQRAATADHEHVHVTAGLWESSGGANKHGKIKQQKHTPSTTHKQRRQRKQIKQTPKHKDNSNTKMRRQHSIIRNRRQQQCAHMSLSLGGGGGRAKPLNWQISSNSWSKSNESPKPNSKNPPENVRENQADERATREEWPDHARETNPQERLPIACTMATQQTNYRKHGSNRIHYN